MPWASSNVKTEFFSMGRHSFQGGQPSIKTLGIGGKTPLDWLYPYREGANAIPGRSSDPIGNASQFEDVQFPVNQVALAEKAGGLLSAMVPNIRKTSDLVQEIAVASAEQASGVGQINAVVSQLSQTTQQNASSSEQLAATAEEMSNQAEQLQQSMTFFKLEGGPFRGH